MRERVSPETTVYAERCPAWWARLITTWRAAVFTAATSAARLLTRPGPARPAGTTVAAEAAEAVPDSASAELAAPATSVTGTALAAVPRRAAGPGAPGLAWRAS